MKLATCLVATALILPGLALAQTCNPAPAPGQSEYAPGHRAKGPGDANDFAPGQRMRFAAWRVTRVGCFFRSTE
jgi:hypothetical protein